MNDIQNKFIGTWKLVYSVEIDANGNKHFPFGEDAIGYIIYDAAGTMAVQISRKKRTLFTSKNFLTASKDELVSLPKDYLAYFGRYEIDENNQIISHFIAAHLNPSDVEKNFQRKYCFYDNKLSLKPWDGTNREILWEKVTI